MLLLTEQDPLQTAFKLSDEFRKLSMIEIEFREEYLELVKVLEQFSCDLISQAWSQGDRWFLKMPFRENPTFDFDKNFGVHPVFDALPVEHINKATR